MLHNAIRIKIVGAKLQTLWYADRLGDEFWAIDVHASDGFSLRILHEGDVDDDRRLYAHRDDCDIIEKRNVNHRTMQVVEVVNA